MPQTGRPTDLTKTVAHNDDGTPITVADRIVSAIRAGAYLEHAAAHTGVVKVQAYEWLKIGARAARTLEADPKTRLTAHQRRCINFANAVAEAQAEWVIRQEAQLEQLARGGILQRTITERIDSDGQLVERTVHDTHTLPDKAVIMWRLERKLPNHYGRKVTIDLHGGGDTVEVDSPEQRADRLGEDLAKFLAGATEQRAIDTTAREVPRNAT